MCLKSNLIFCIIFVISIQLMVTPAKSFHLKFTKIYCNNTDESFATFTACHIKPVSRYVQYITLKLKLHQKPISNLTTRFQFVQRTIGGYQPFLYDFTFTCGFTKHLDPFKAIIWKMFLDLSNMKVVCPFGDFELERLENRYIEEKLKNLPVPEGDFAMFAYWSFFNKPTFNVKTYWTFYN